MSLGPPEGIMHYRTARPYSYAAAAASNRNNNNNHRSLQRTAVLPELALGTALGYGGPSALNYAMDSYDAYRFIPKDRKGEEEYDRSVRSGDVQEYLSQERLLRRNRTYNPNLSIEEQREKIQTPYTAKNFDEAYHLLDSILSNKAIIQNILISVVGRNLGKYELYQHLTAVHRGRKSEFSIPFNDTLIQSFSNALATEIEHIVKYEVEPPHVKRNFDKFESSFAPQQGEEFEEEERERQQSGDGA